MRSNRGSRFWGFVPYSHIVGQALIIYFSVESEFPFVRGSRVGTVYFLEHGLSGIGLEKSTLLKGLKRGLLWSSGFGVVALLLYFVMSLFGISLMRFIRSSLPTEGLAGFLLLGAVIGPIAEELFFRGVVFGYFRRWGVMAAVIASTVLFALAHSAAGGVGVPQIVGGIVFAVAYELEGSIMVPVTIHVLGNSAIFALSIVL